jgi:hypothetical protein
MQNGAGPLTVKPVSKNRKVGWALFAIIFSLLAGSIAYVFYYNSLK